MSTAKNKSSHTHRSLIRSTSLLSFGTLVSRILGFLRDIVLAGLLGTGVLADAFFVAFKIPNLLRDLVGEGAVNAAIVPVLTEYKEREKPADFWSFVNVVLVWGGLIVIGLSLLGMLLADPLVRVVVPGFVEDSSKFELTVSLTRILFPYLALIGMTAYAMAILYTFHSFLIPAFTSCFLNLSLIASALVIGVYLNHPIIGLVVGVLIGGVLQLWFQFPALKAIGFRWQRPQTLKHPGAVQIGKLLIPRMVGSGIYQLTVLVDTFCASLVGGGAISAIYYANRIVQFPLGVVGVSLASAGLPVLSKFAHLRDRDSLRRTLVFALENIFFIMFPMMMLMVLLSGPIMRVLFERGEFGAESTEITAWTLSFYALGLFSFGGVKMMVTAFHAMQDTKTPVKMAAVSLMINTILNFALMKPLGVGGIALASAIAGTVNFVSLFLVMEKRDMAGLGKQIFRFIAKVLLAALLTGGLLSVCWQNLKFEYEWLKLILLSVGSMLCYGLCCLLFKVEQAEQLCSWLLKRR